MESEEIIVHGLPEGTTETHIINTLSTDPSTFQIQRSSDDYRHCSTGTTGNSTRVPLPAVKSFQIARNRRTGESKGFAILTFSSPQDADLFMEIYKDGFPLVMNNIDHSQREEEVEEGEYVMCRLTYKRANRANDWICSKCFGYNFSSRYRCFKCRCDKPDEMAALTNDGSRDIQEEENNILIVRNLDALTTVEKFFEDLWEMSRPLQVMLMFDKLTGSSCSFGFVMYENDMDASWFLFEKRIIIDGAEVKVNFASIASLKRFGKNEWVYARDGSLIPWIHERPSKTSSSPDNDNNNEDEDADLNDFYAELAELEDPKEEDAGGLTQMEQEIQSDDPLKCALCEIKYSRPELLSRHIKESELHKLNYQNFRQSKSHFEEEEAAELMRLSDSAHMKHRMQEDKRRWLQESFNKRKQYSSSSSSLSKKNRRRDFDDHMDRKRMKELGFMTADEARDFMDNQQQSAESSSVGARLMQKMGWKSGEGLGKDGEGTSKPIEAVTYGGRAGIGSTSKKTVDDFTKEGQMRRRYYRTYSNSNQ